MVSLKIKSDINSLAYKITQEAKNLDTYGTHLKIISYADKIIELTREL